MVIREGIKSLTLVAKSSHFTLQKDASSGSVFAKVKETAATG
jgi:hypothetical protein